MRRNDIKWDKIKNLLIMKYLLSYFCRLNILKSTTKAPSVDLSRLNTLKRTIRKVMKGTGVGKEQKKNHGREGDLKTNRARKKTRKNVRQSKLHFRAIIINQRRSLSMRSLRTQLMLLVWAV